MELSPGLVEKVRAEVAARCAARYPDIAETAVAQHLTQLEVSIDRHLSRRPRAGTDEIAAAVAENFRSGLIALITYETGITQATAESMADELLE